MKNYKVSAGGQMSFPAEVRSEWFGRSSAGGHIQIAVLGKIGLIIPDGTQWAVIEHLYPESELYNRSAGIIASDVQNPPSQSANTMTVAPFNRYRVNKSSKQYAVPTQLRKNWNLDHDGGTIKTELHPMALTLRRQHSREDLISCVPDGILTSGEWSYNRANEFTPQLARAYTQWCSEQAASLIGNLQNGGWVNSVYPDKKRTFLEYEVGKSVMIDVLRIASEHSSQ